MSSQSRQFDCIVCGETCVDISVRPIDRSRPLIDREIDYIDSVVPGTGGIVPNSGMAMARFGLSTCALGCVGNDLWGRHLVDELDREGVDTAHVIILDDAASSVTVVAGGEDGEHTFLFHPGASQSINRAVIEDRLDLFAKSRFALFGYYALMPNLENDLADVLPKIRETGCKVALDTTAGGGSMSPLDRILPHLDIYIPSLVEARTQTRADDPRAMINAFREFAPTALLGVKLGSHGVLLSPADNDWIEVAPIAPPGPAVDTTGAGDCFYAGFIAGLVRGLSISDAGRLGAAAGSMSVTGIGAVAGLGNYDSLLVHAGVG